MVGRCQLIACSVLLALVAVSFAQPSPFYPGNQILEVGEIILKGLQIVDPRYGSIGKGNIYMNQGNITRVVYSNPDPFFPVGNASSFTIIDYDNADQIGGGPYYAIPGFISTASSMTFRSAIGSGQLAADAAFFQAGLAADFATLNPTSSASADQMARAASYTTVLKAALESGVTTWIDMVSNPTDFAFLRDTYAKDQVIFYPNMYSLGPVIAPAGAFPAFTDNTPWKFTIDPVNPNLAALTTALQQWFDPRGVNLLGVTLICDSPATPTVSMTTSAITSVISQILSLYPNKTVAFVSNNANNMIAAANAGAKVHFGAPFEPKQEDPASNVPACRLNSLTYDHVLCQTATSALQTLVQRGVVHTTMAAAVDGAAYYYLNSFTSYPMPSSPVYNPRSYYSLGMPQSIRSNYEAIWSSVVSNSAVAGVKATFQATSQSTYLPVMNYAASQGVPFIVASGSGSPFVFHSDSLLEAQLLTGVSNAFANNSMLLNGMTHAAAQAFGMGNRLGLLVPGYVADVVVLGGTNPITTPPSQWKIINVFKFGYKQPDVGLTYTFGTALALGSLGFAVLLIILFVSYTLCCARIAENAKRGDMAQSML